MPSRRLTICEALVDRLSEIDGMEARWLHEGEQNENTEVAEGGTPQIVVVPGSDTLTGHQSNLTDRTLNGHIIFEANLGTPMDEGRRADLDELACEVEAHLLGISADNPTLGVGGVTKFDLTEVVTTFDGGGAGRWSTRFDWTCNYRVSALDPREPA